VGGLVLVALVAGGARASARDADAPSVKASAAPAAAAVEPVAAPASRAPYQLTFAGAQALRDGMPISDPDFYAAVERPDLAARYRDLQSRKSLWATAGGLLLAVGAIWGGIDLTIVETHAERRSTHRSPTLIPWGIALVGAVGVGVSFALPGQPVSAQERQALARDHNAKGSSSEP
jgi:hypothetical protein